MKTFKDVILEIYLELTKRQLEHFKQWKRHGNDQNLGKSDAMEEACQVIEKITGINQGEAKP